MKNRTLLGTGIFGSIIAAICCFSPVLLILLGAIGLSAWLAWLDFVLLPALAIFLAVTVYAAFRMLKTPSEPVELEETK